MRSPSHSGMNGSSTASVPALDPSIRMGTQRKLMSSSSRRRRGARRGGESRAPRLTRGTTAGVPRCATRAGDALAHPVAHAAAVRG